MYVNEADKQAYLRMISGYVTDLVQWQQSLANTPVTSPYLYDFMLGGPSGFAGTWWIKDRARPSKNQGEMR